jgi:hypothetical protein
LSDPWSQLLFVAPDAVNFVNIVQPGERDMKPSEEHLKPTEECQAPEGRQAKKAYSSPRLEVYGKLRDIAQNVGLAGAADGGVNPNHMATR